jgi:phosphoglycerate dehydrogenase-like enzyme
MSTARLRVHVQQSKGSLDVFQVTRERLMPALESEPALLGRLDLSFGADRAALDAALRDTEVLFVGNFENENLRERAPRLRWVQSIFAGVEKLSPFIPDGVVLTNGSGVHAPKAAEYGICALLMLNSQVPQIMASQRKRRWEPLFTPVIAGKTVVIVGTGKLGFALAEQARHFRMRVIGVSRSGKAVAGFDAVLPIGQLESVLPQADFLVSTLPNTPEAKHRLGARQFSLMPRGAGFLSIGRGQAVDETALVAALQSGQLGGAVMDVFEVEPLPEDSPLWQMDNVVISGHCAIDDLDAYLARAIDIFKANLRRYIAGEPLENVVDTKRGY